MRKKVHIKVSHILMSSAIIMIYFQIYWHYWFVKSLGGYVVNTLLPIIVLFCGFVFKEFISADWNGRVKKSISYLSTPLFCYVFFASISIALNEDGLNNIKRFFIYIYSPVIIFISIWGLYIYRKNENIKFTLNVLFILSVIFSIYVTITYSIYPSSVSEMTVLETNRGEVHGDTGAAYGIGYLEAIRYTIPGISSTTYGPLLVPLIFVGLFFRKNSSGKLKYFYDILILFLVFCVLMTVSRGPLVSSIAGMIYLVLWKWFKIREIIFVTVILAVSFLTFAKLSFIRILITLVAFFPIDVSYLAYNASDLIAEDPRRLSIGETTSYILQHPLFGIGMSNLINMQDLSYGKEHNNYLSLAASFGLLSLTFYILFILLLFIMMHKNIKKLSNNPSIRDTGITLGAGLLALIVYLNFAPAEFHFIWIWFGLTAAWLRNAEKEILFKRRFQLIERKI